MASVKRDYLCLFECPPWIELLGVTAIGFRPMAALVKSSLHEEICIAYKFALSAMKLRGFIEGEAWLH